MAEQTIPDFTFGVISDVQHAIEPSQGTNYAGDKIRYYMESVGLLETACEHWKGLQDFRFVLQLGDLVDGHNDRHGNSEQALRNALQAFSVLPPSVEVHHAIGNHELYCFDTFESFASVLGSSSSSSRDRNSGPSHRCPSTSDWYYSFCPCPSLRFINLNTFWFSAHSWQGQAVREEAEALVASKNPNEDKNSSAHLPKGHPDSKYVLYNGALGLEQEAWLERELADARQAAQKVVVFSHAPLNPHLSADAVTWSSDTVYPLLQEEYADVVVLVLAGHCHFASYPASTPESEEETEETEGREGPLFFVLDAVLETSPEDNHFLTVSVKEGQWIKVDGFGSSAPSRTIHIDLTAA